MAILFKKWSNSTMRAHHKNISIKRVKKNNHPSKSSTASLYFWCAWVLEMWNLGLKSMGKCVLHSKFNYQTNAADPPPPPQKMEQIIFKLQQKWKILYIVWFFCVTEVNTNIFNFVSSTSSKRSMVSRSVVLSIIVDPSVLMSFIYV